MLNPFADLGVRFADPWWLLLLLLIPVLSWLRGNLGGRPSVLFSSTHILRALGREAESRRGSFLSSLLLLALSLLILALGRPQLGRSLDRIKASGIDIILALDVSKSMLAEDFSIGRQRANRVEAIREVTRKFIEGRPNDRIGMIAFAGRPYMVSPLTLDHNWLLKNLERVKIGLVEDGTAIGSAIGAGANRLKNRDTKSRIMILLTDGDNNAGKISPDTATEAAKALGIKIYTIGAGSNGPVPYPQVDVFGSVHYAMREFPLDETTLRMIADKTGGTYQRATNTRSLEEIFAEIDKLEKTTVEHDVQRSYNDLFPWFAGAGAFVLLGYLVVSQTVWRRLP